MAQPVLTLDPKRFPEYHREQKRLFAQAFGAAAREHPDAMHGVNKQRFATLLQSDPRFKTYLDTYDEALFDLNSKYIGGQGSGQSASEDADESTGLLADAVGCELRAVGDGNDSDSESSSPNADPQSPTESFPTAHSPQPAADPVSDALTNTESFPTAHSPQPAADPDADAASTAEPLTANSQEPTAAVPPKPLNWMTVFGVKTFDVARITTDERLIALRRVKSFVYRWLKKLADHYEPHGEGEFDFEWDQVPRNAEPSAFIASELQMPEGKLNALMREACGMSVRQTWDYLRIEKAVDCILKTNDEHIRMGVMQRQCYGLVEEHLRKMKRKQNITNADYATWCGFKNLARMNVACLNRYNRSLQGVLMQRMTQVCDKARAWVDQTTAAIRTRCTDFSYDHDQQLHFILTQTLDENAVTVDDLIKKLNQALQIVSNGRYRPIPCR